MSKILIVPDVHGRKFWHKAIEMIDEVDQVVFLGDYLDPYSYEGITFEDALIELEGILAFKEDYPDKVVLLVGNHDMHYIKTEFIDLKSSLVFSCDMSNIFFSALSSTSSILLAPSYPKFIISLEAFISFLSTDFSFTISA